MSVPKKSLRIAFIHPDLGIGGAERLVVDAALGLQKLGHHIEIYTSHHDPKHCFDETRDGTLKVIPVASPFPRTLAGKFYIVMANLRQLWLICTMLMPTASKFDVFFVDQLSTCVPFLRYLAGRRVVFYCHFPDKLLANGAYVEGQMRKRGGLLKRLYRLPMDWLEEYTTRSADIILANSTFTSNVFKAYFPSIPQLPRVVYPGVNFAAYEPLSSAALGDPDVVDVSSDRPTFLSMNRFEKKKNVALALEAFALLRQTLPESEFAHARLICGGGYDPRVEDNVRTLDELLERSRNLGLSYELLKPRTSTVALPPARCPSREPDVIFLLNFSTPQRAALLNARSTRALLYTPANEHFGIGPVEGMACGVPVLAADSGGPTESVVDGRTGWLRTPVPNVWAEALAACVRMSASERGAMAAAGRARASELFGMEAMAAHIDEAVREAAARGPVAPGWTYAAEGVGAAFVAGFLSSVCAQRGVAAERGAAPGESADGRVWFAAAYAALLFLVILARRLFSFGAYTAQLTAGPVPSGWRSHAGAGEMVGCAVAILAGAVLANVFVEPEARQYGPPHYSRLFE